MDRKLFDTKERAQKEIDAMRGWNAKPAPVTVYDGDNNVVNRWGVMCKQGKTSLWLRDDGYVR